MHYVETNPHGEKGILEKKVDGLSSTLNDFIDSQLLTSFLLFFCIFLAVIISNLNHIAVYYNTMLNTPFGFHFNGFLLSVTIRQFVNDFLLTIFFFMLGLEIKREFVIGELSEISNSMFVLFCAIGGTLFPIITYLLINFHKPQYINGWAIPMATDTALAIGVLYLFKSKLSQKVFTLVASLAVIDDILSILVIAIFYSDNFNSIMFLSSLFVLLMLIIINRCGFRNPIPYIILGIILWASIEMAGIHGTIAGVLTAMCIPARPKSKPKTVINRIRCLLNKFESEYDDDKHVLEDELSHQILEKVTEKSLEATTPLKRWENRLEAPVLILILPLFALANGGFNINAVGVSEILFSSLFWGIFIGLVIAKPLGVFFTFSLIKKTQIIKTSIMPSVSDAKVIAFLSGIGYTMSIFLSEMAFQQQLLSEIAKVAIFISSISSSIIVITTLKKRFKTISKNACSSAV